MTSDENYGKIQRPGTPDQLVWTYWINPGLIYLGTGESVLMKMIKTVFIKKIRIKWMSQTPTGLVDCELKALKHSCEPM